MRKMSKRSSAVVAAAVAVGAVAAGTVAYAAFNREAAASAGSQGAETFEPLTVEAEWLGVRPDHTEPAVSAKLLPGDKADVKLTIANPEGNSVNGKVVSITPVALTASQPTGIASADREYCRGALTLRTFTPGSALVIPNNDQHILELHDAVVLHENTDIRCEGMEFPVKYTVVFEGTREAVAEPTSLS